MTKVANSGSATGEPLESLAKGTVFILFIETIHPKKGLFETLNGADGWIEYREDNYDKIMGVISPFREKGKIQLFQERVKNK